MVSYNNTIRVIECLISKINFAQNEKVQYIPLECVNDYAPTLRKFEKLGLIKLGYTGKSYDPKNKTYGIYVKEITNEGWYVFGKYFTQSVKTEDCENNTTKIIRCKMPIRCMIYYLWLQLKFICSTKFLWILSICGILISNWSEVKSFTADMWNKFPIDYKLIKIEDLNKF
jgi:hypothetical protein